MCELFYRAYQFISPRRGWALALLLMVVLGLLAVANRIQFEDDITALIPANEEANRIQKVLKSITFTDKIVVNIYREQNGTVDDLTQYATELLDSIQKNNAGFVKNIQGRVDEDDVRMSMELVYANLPLFLDSTDYITIDQRLVKDSIDKIVGRNYRTLISPSGIVAKKTILNDPLGLTFIALKKLQQMGGVADFKIKNGFLIDQKERNLLLFLSPTFGSNGTDKNIPFSDDLYALQEKLNTKYEGKTTSAYYGAALVAVANAKQIRKDIQLTVSIAMTLLILLLMFFYKKVTLPIILLLPTIFGVLLALAFLALLRTNISAISLGIGSILLGVTIDYSLHILTHIRNGKDLKSLFNEVAPSILMSSLTTASAFLCLLFLESQALQDLGIFAAVSVIGASIFTLLFLPQVYRTINKETKITTLDRLASYQIHRNKWAISAIVAVFILSLFTYSSVIFNHDLTKLNYETEGLVAARDRLEKLTDIGSKSIYLSTYGTDRESVLLQNDSLYENLEQLKEKGNLLNFSSIGALVHSKKIQERKIAGWNHFWNKEKIAEVQKNLIASGAGYGFKENTFDGFFSHLDSRFKPLDVDDFSMVKAFSVDDYIVEDENGTTITSLVKVDQSHIDTLRHIFANVPNTLLIDRQQVNESFLGSLKNDFNSLLLYSLISVIAILFLFYRSFSLTLVTAVPIFLTWYLTVGIMGLFHIEFNIFNIIICSFIFGLGVDYSIFMTNGMLTEYRTGEKTLPTHKTSIILSVITTIAGVGVMIFAKHPVLYTISVVSLIGILSAVLVAFTIQPLLFRLFIGSIEKRPINLRYLLHSILSFGYFGTGAFLLSVYAFVALKISPSSRMKPNMGYHKLVSKVMGSVLYTNPFVRKKINNPYGETFEKPAMLIANHTSFLDILAIGMLHPKIIFLVNDWVFHSPVFGHAAKLAGAYPVSGGIENGEEYLKEKVRQGFSIIAFPEGTRSNSNKIKRFHKGAFYLAEQFNLDILPVLIHGNSEVLPKGSFIIRDGSITIELLQRISCDDPNFGSAYNQKSKKIGAYFKHKFARLRDQIETKSYWHKTILENFRYKGDNVYQSVRKDLIANAAQYKSVMDNIGKKETIIHLSQEYGVLDLLLTLDSIDRRIWVYLADDGARKLLANNFLTHKYSKITVMDSVENTFLIPAKLLIIGSDSFKTASIDVKKMVEIGTIILFKSATVLEISEINQLGFATTEQNDKFIVLKKMTK